MSEEYALNDPRLEALTGGDFDPSGDIEYLPTPPPEDGIHPVAFKLRPDQNGMHPGAYLKGDEKGNRVVVRLSGRFINEDGTFGGYLNDYYLTSLVSEGQTTSPLAFFCRLVGHPLRRDMTLGQMRDHVVSIFEAQGELGFQVNAQTRWYRNSPMVDGDGNPVQDLNGRSQRLEVKGMSRVADRARLEYGMFFEGEYPGVEVSDAILKVLENRWHLYYDPVAQQVKSVKSEVTGLMS